MSDQKETTGETIKAEATIEREINGNKISEKGTVRLLMTPDGKDLIVLPDAARPRLSERASSEASQNSTEQPKTLTTDEIVEASQNSTEQPKTLTTDEIVEASKRLRGEVERHQHITRTDIAKIMRDVLVDAINELYPMMSAHRWREAEFFLKSPDFMLLGVDVTTVGVDSDNVSIGRILILESRTKGPPRGTMLYHASEALLVKYYYPTNQCRAYIEHYRLVKTCEGLFHHFNTERITDMLDEKYGLAPPRHEERNGQ